MSKKCFMLLFLFLASHVASVTAHARTIPLRLVEWAGYVSFLKDDFRDYAMKHHNMDIEIQIVKPDITDENQLFYTIRGDAKGVDICTPSSSFYRARNGKLMKLLAPLDPSKVPNYAKIPKALRESPLFRDDEGRLYGIVFLAGQYGLAYNMDKVENEPDSWEVLWSEKARHTYSVNAETAFVNAYISYWVEQPADPTNVYDIDKVNIAKLQRRLDRLAAGAKFFWSGFGNTAEQLKTLHYTATWGFGISAAHKAGQHWKFANPKEGVPLCVDGISLTKQAANDPAKMRAFYVFADFLTSEGIQLKLMDARSAFPLNKDVKDHLTPENIQEYHVGDEQYFDNRFFWHPMSDRTINGYQMMWKTAMHPKRSIH